MNVPQPKEEHLDVLRKYFGHQGFRPMQWKIIYSVIEEKRDNCVVMATGYGKSLCYQYPAVYCNGLTVVISPLISLMQDQVLSLQMSNIPACFLGSAQRAVHQSLNEVLSGVCRVLYVTPEWSTSETGESTLKKIISCRQITLLAIDEAHCVSQWGHDFRSAYRKLSCLRNILPSVPILALTATATPPVRKDICLSLKLRDPRITVTSFNRPNLFFAVHAKTSKIDQIYRNLSPAMEKTGVGMKFPAPTIIYCASKNRTEEVADALQRNNIKCGAYHAGLSLRERNEVHEKFLRDQLDTVVATVAFGMGIDKPNVRCVIHYGQPKDIESYYQEVGRAGRDGLPAHCHIFCSDEDKVINRMVMARSSNQKFQEHKEKMMKLMQYFCETRHCRRHLLLSYFDENLAKEPEGPPKPNCCDNCDKLIKRGLSERPSEKIDLIDEIKLLLRVFDYFDGRFGLTVPIKFLRGLRDAKIPEYKMSSKLYGTGKEHSENAWKALAKLCIRENLLQEKSVGSFKGRGSFRNAFPVSTVAISQKGRDFLTCDHEDGLPFELSEQAEILFKKKKKPPASTATETKSWIDNLTTYKKDRSEKKQEEQTAFLYRELKKVRDKIAEDLQYPQHTVADDGACFLMSLYPPNDLKELATVKGFNEMKAEKFGQLFLDKINEFFGKEIHKKQEERESNENDEEDFLKMKHLHENAVSYVDEKYAEYILTDEVLNDFENDDLLGPTTSASSETQNFDAEKPCSTNDMWGDEPDNIFDDFALDQVVTNSQGQCSQSPSELASKLISMNDSCMKTDNEKNLTSTLMSMDDGWKESKKEAVLTSSLFTIDSTWKEATRNEVTASLLSSDNDWTGVQKSKDVTSSLVSVDNKWDDVREEKNMISSLMSVESDRKQCTLLSPPLDVNEKKCSVKLPSKSATAGKSNIAYEDDSDEETKEPATTESNKRSIPQWLTQPEAIKKRMKSNSIFKSK